MSYQLFRLMARMDSVFACNDQAPADRNDWRELKRHIVRMKTTLTLVHLTLREERERGVSLTAQTARKLEGYTRWGLCYPTPSVADPEKSSCQNVGSPCRVHTALGDRRHRLPEQARDLPAALQGPR